MPNAAVRGRLWSQRGKHELGMQREARHGAHGKCGQATYKWIKNITYKGYITIYRMRLCKTGVGKMALVAKMFYHVNVAT